MESIYCIKRIDKGGLLLIMHLNKKQKNEILYACAIGDGCITIRKSGNGFLHIKHGQKQKEYLEWKANLLAKALEVDNIVVHEINGKDYSFNGYNMTGKKVELWTPYKKKFVKIRNFLYKNGHKRINRYCLNRLEELGLSIWYMDDGSLNNQRVINFNTYTSDYSEHVGIQKWFREKWNIETKIMGRNRNNKVQYYIHLNTLNSKKLIDIIAKYVLQIESMKYKISMNYTRDRKNNLSYNIDRLANLYGNIE